MQALIIIEAHGKANAWSRITKQIRMPSLVVATGGHVCQFPRKLFPLGIDMRKGKTLDYGRKPDPEKVRDIIKAVSSVPETCPIVIAMDNDVEGDVIAYDVVEIILSHFPKRASRMVRVRPGPITTEGVRAALASAERISGRRIVNDAIHGRARAVTDRWIGSTFSKIAGVPVGRVRSAVLGSTYLLNRAPKYLRGRPETGEITFQARSAMGGRPFVARISLTGEEDPDYVRKLMRLARRYSGLLVPGAVRPLQSLSAAIAPRIGTVRPFNTADALAYASRYYGVSSGYAMRGLQDAYQAGLISYPRTDSRDLSRSSASKVVMLGFSCGLSGLDADVLGTEGRISPNGDMVEIDNHEALHPVLRLSTVNSERLRQMVRRPIRKPEAGWTRPELRDLMASLVARRAFEAAKEIQLEAGIWNVNNVSGVDAEDADILSDLEWSREIGYNYPWSRHLITGVREWPMESVLLDLMASEGLGRPATYAGHLRTATESGEIETAAFPAPPRPSPKGMRALRRTPKSVWNPATCRMIETVIGNPDNFLRENPAGTLGERARFRVLSWFKAIPEEMREPLQRSLSASQSGGRRDGRKKHLAQAAAPGSPATSGMEVPQAPPEPSPYNT
jgi:DNA topoisomerase-1